MMVSIWEWVDIVLFFGIPKNFTLILYPLIMKSNGSKKNKWNNSNNPNRLIIIILQLSQRIWFWYFDIGRIRRNKDETMNE